MSTTTNPVALRPPSALACADTAAAALREAARIAHDHRMRELSLALHTAANTADEAIAKQRSRAVRAGS